MSDDYRLSSIACWRRAIRRTAVALLIGALFAMICWWPIEGAVAAVFWPIVFDARGPQDIAIDRLLNDQDSVVYPLIRHGPLIGGMSDENCSWRLDLLTGQMANSRLGVSQLNTLIHHERNDRNTNYVYFVAKEALKSLPKAELGALQGCVEGSLFASVCRGYLAQLITEYLTAHKRELSSKADMNDADAIRMACATLESAHEPPSRVE